MQHLHPLQTCTHMGQKGLSRDSPDSRLVCRHDRTAEFTSNPDSLMPQRGHSVKPKASHDSRRVPVLAGDTGKEPTEFLGSASTGSLEQFEWSRYLRDSDEKCSLMPDVELQNAVRFSSVLKKSFNIQDVSDSEELDSEQSVACSQSVSKCSASCSEVSARRKDTVSSTDRIQNDCEDSIASVDKFVCSSVAAASSQDVVCSLDDAYACSDEVVATLQCEQIVDVIAEAVDHVCFTAASLQADVSSPSVYACSSEVSVAERSRRLADCSKEDFVHDFVDRDCSPVIDDVSTEMFACSTGFLSTHCSQRELVDDVQDCVHDDVSTHCSDVVVNDRLAVPVAELQFSRRSCLADSQNEAMFTSDDDCVSVNRRRGIRSRSCSAVTDLEHSRRSNLTDSWNKAVFTPKACSVVGNCCSHSCSRSTRSEADMVDDDCQHVTVEQKLSTNVPVHNQLGEVVDEVSNCSESLQTVQSDVCQVVKQVEAAGTFEHSGTQCSVNAEQLSRDTRQSGSARKCLFTDYYVSGPGQTRNGQLSED